MSETPAPPSPPVDTLPPLGGTPPPAAPATEPPVLTMPAAGQPAPAVETAPPAPPPPAPREPELESFRFHGDEREYFRIWIVNTLITLLTFGVFAAWAKVRKRRYLRGNTELMGHRFDYRADPRRILIGNLVVATLFVAYSVFGQVYPVVAVVTLLVGLVMLPWIVVRSLAFNAHNTTYRGMRFYYHQSLSLAFLTYLAQPLVIVVTLGLYYPAWVRNRTEFVIANHQLGDSFFRFNSKSGPFYSAYFFSGLILLAAGALGGMLMGLVMMRSGNKVPGPAELVPFLALYGLGFYTARHYAYSRVFNQTWNHTRLDDHRFIASMKPNRWLGMQMVNLGAMIISCGLLYPWAAIRSTRYALACLQFQPTRPIEKTSRLGRSEGSALGETASEFVGLDFGL